MGLIVQSGLNGVSDQSSADIVSSVMNDGEDGWYIFSGGGFCHFFITEGMESMCIS